MNRRSSLFISLLLCIPVLFLAESAVADGVVRDSVGAISSGRGGTNIAHSDNGVIILSNPAGMVNIPSTQLFEVGLDLLITDLRYRDPENDRNAHVNPYPLPQFSYIRRTKDNRLAYGIGVYAPAGFGGTWDIVNPLLGDNTYKTFSALGKVLPSVAARVTDKLSVGASLGVGINHSEMEAPFFIQTGALRGLPTKMDIQGTGAAPTWSVGMQYKLSEKTTIGMVYVDETRFKLNGKGNVDAFLVPGMPPTTSRFDVQTDIDWPRQFGFGIVHQLRPQHRVSLDLFWTQWSHAFNRIDLAFRNPSNPVFLAFGPEIRDSLTLDWKDSVTVKAGWEWFITPRDTFRAGYTHTSQTIPSSTLTPLIPATLEHSFTFGYGKAYCCSRVDLAYQFAFGPNRSMGVNRVVGSDFDFSAINARAHWLMLSYTKFF